MATIRHELLVETDDAVRGVEAAASALGDYSDEASSAEKSSKGLSKQTKALGATLAGVSAAAAVGIKRAVDYGDALGKMSERTGRSVEELSALRRAAENSDTSLEVVARGLNALAARGVTDSLEDIADQFANMENGTAKMARASELFGEGLGRKLIPLLNQGAEGLRKNAEISRTLGTVWSDDASQAAEDFNDAMADLKRVGDGLFSQAAQFYVPTLSRLAQGALDGALAFLELGDSYERTVAGMSDAELLAKQEADARRDLAGAIELQNQAEEQIAIGRERGVDAIVQAGQRQLDAANAGIEASRRRLDAAKTAIAAEGEEREAIAARLRELKLASEQGAVVVEKAEERKREARRETATEMDALAELMRQRQMREAEEEDAYIKESIARREAYYAERERLAEQSARQQEEIERTLTSTILSVTSQLVNGIGRALRDLSNERTKDAEERRNREVGLAILMGEIQAGLAFANTLAQFPGGASPAAYAAAAAAAAAVGTATKISAAAGYAASKESFHDGGLIGDEIDIRARRGEVVVSAPQVRAVGGPENVQQAVEQRGGRGDIVVVQKLDHRVLDVQLHRAVQRTGSPLDSALRATNPRGTGRRNPYQARA